MMRRLLLGIALSLAACAPPGAGGYALANAVNTYAEGVRWQRFEAAAVVIPNAERVAFLDERDALAKDLRITETEILRITEHGRTADVAIKLAWYSDREGTLRETVAHQQWERQGKAWRLVDEVRGRGDPMPGLREPADSESGRGSDDASVARAAAD